MSILIFAMMCLVDGSQAQTVTIDPIRDRSAVKLAVHHDRPSLVVFDRAPDGKMIASDESRWYISTPGNGLPDHAFHFKPKTTQSGVGNAFFFFDGYPIELVFESTEKVADATTLLYIVVARNGDAPERRDRRERLKLDSSKPAVAEVSARQRQAQPAARRQAQSLRPPDLRMQPESKAGNAPNDAGDADAPANPVALRFFDKHKRTKVGTLRWNRETGSVLFKAREGMARLINIEVVRAKKPWWTQQFEIVHPLAASVQLVGAAHLLEFDLVHLGRWEGYYVRLFFEGSREPVLIRLRGLGRAP